MEQNTKVLTVNFKDKESIKTAVLVLDQEIDIRRKALIELTDVQNSVITAQEQILRSIRDNQAIQHKVLRKSVAQAIGLEERVPEEVEIFIEPLEIHPLLNNMDTLLLLKRYTSAETVGKDADKKKK
jgi:hypothetical protein